MPKIINGKELADKLMLDLKEKASNAKIKPGIAVILVGENPASMTYVRNKMRRVSDLGFNGSLIKIPIENDSPIPEYIPSTESKILTQINRLNQNPDCHGILVQLPLPDNVSEEKILEAISPNKDVDGFHPYNMGKLWSGKPNLVPSTPAGIMKMLEAYNVSISGKHAVIMGRSNIVGKPMAQMLLDKDATVTIVHSKTQNIKEITRTADILIVAIGKGHFVDKSFIKKHAVVIDVGINRNENGKLIGDVNFDDVYDDVSLITPVPGGVGPMTIAMLMDQTYNISLKDGQQ